VAFQAGFWLGNSGSDHCQHPRAPPDQIHGSTVSFDAASNHRVDDRVLAFSRVLELCAGTLFQREFVSCRVRFPQRISQGMSAEESGRYSWEITLY